MLMIERALRGAPPASGETFWPKYLALKQRLLSVEYGQTMSGFPNGNDHGPRHIGRVLEHLDRLLAPAPLAHINQYELFLTMVAVVYHDVGILRGRAGHAGTSATLLEAERNDYLLDAIDRTFVAAAVASHSSNVAIDARAPDDQHAKGFSVRPRMIAALVRLADELDEDIRRADPTLESKLELPNEAQFYWRFCQRVIGVHADSNKKDITFNLRFAPEDIQGHFVRLVFQKLLKTNRERVTCNRFLPDALRWKEIRVIIQPVGSEMAARHIVFGDETALSEVEEQLPAAIRSANSSSFSGPVQSASQPLVEHKLVGMPLRVGPTAVPPPTRRAVSVALIHRDRVLLLLRASDTKSGAGLWQLPGGKLEASESPIRAALREMQEELGWHPPEAATQHIAELADVWLPASTKRALSMSVYLVELPPEAAPPAVTLSAEHDEYRWVDIRAPVSLNMFGVTERVLRLLRRYRLLHQPLTLLAEALERGIPLSTTADSHIDSTLLSLLGLLGFVDDRTQHPTSPLSASIIRTLAAWALTEGTLFGDVHHVGGQPWPMIPHVHRHEREGASIFERHDVLLQALSTRLAKAVSNRSVADVILTARDKTSERLYLLLRWDLLAQKFQIPARGLEELDVDAPSDAFSAARHVIESRVSHSLASVLDYVELGRFETSHLSAGSLNDGPLMRKYDVAVFGAEAPPGEASNILSALERANRRTVNALNDENATLTLQSLRTMAFFAWAPIDDLHRGAFGERHPLQGYDEIASALGAQAFHFARVPMAIDIDKIDLPVFPFRRRPDCPPNAMRFLPWLA